MLFLIGLTFASLGLVMTPLAPGYDDFNYYFTLVLTPMFILWGVFYPVDSLPAVLQGLVQLLPLAHAVDLVRPLVASRPVTRVALHLGVLAAYAVVAFPFAVALAAAVGCLAACTIYISLYLFLFRVLLGGLTECRLYA